MILGRMQYIVYINLQTVRKIKINGMPIESLLPKSSTGDPT